MEQARFDRPSPVATVIFRDKLNKAHEHLSSRGVLAGPVQDGGDMQFFEIRDTERALDRNLQRTVKVQASGRAMSIIVCSRNELNSYPRMKSLFRRLCSLATWSDMLAEPHQS